ncbi:Abi family protein [Parvibaculum sp.]|uniref:Abi family protein n=1 Tax=Parvibaculum sp. TaxID=2024848 RepID=UPI003299A075
MEITDEPRAKFYLSRVNYYRLSAYWYPFREKQTVVDPNTGVEQTTILDTFKQGTHFSHALDLYVFDKKLRLMALDALERIEIALRADLAILLGQRAPLAHRDPSQPHGHFSRRRRNPQAETEHEKWLRILDGKVERSREDFALHFRRRYPGADMPIWVAAEIWDFGALSHLYAGLLQADRDAIAQSYGVPDGRIFERWLRVLNDVRNICAHHSRLWNKPLVNIPRMGGPGDIPAFDHIQADRRAQTRVYAAFAIMRHMVGVINPNSSWCLFLLEHLGTFPDNAYVSLKNAGFPDGWEQQVIWAG